MRTVIRARAWRSRRPANQSVKTSVCRTSTMRIVSYKGQLVKVCSGKKQRNRLYLRKSALQALTWPSSSPHERSDSGDRTPEQAFRKLPRNLRSISRTRFARRTTDGRWVTTAPRSTNNQGAHFWRKPCYANSLLHLLPQLR